MNHVRKGPPPGALVTYRLAPAAAGDPPRAARYNDDDPEFTANVKPAIREALVAEQRNVCCYCTDRITPTRGGMKIEHRVPQGGPGGDPSRDLDWSNLLGACCGAKPNPSGRGAMVLHCDSAKGDEPIALDPTDASHVKSIRYEGSGRVTSTRPQHAFEIDNVLRLNVDPLVALRAQALEALKAELRSRYGVRSFPGEKLAKLLLRTRDPPGQPLRPFSGFLCWWLERALRKAA